jgi:CRISPR-associated protein Cas5h
MKQLVSIDFHADFGMLKKPDTNDPIYITFNMLHKPTLLGILGAIVGLKGFEAPESKSKKKATAKKGELTLEFDEDEEKKYFIAEYYSKLHHIPIGIKPIGEGNGNFSKTVIKYNNGVGYANQDGGNLIVTEQTLINPAYRCFLLLDLSNEIEHKLYNYLKNCEAELLPYLGKNEFSIWWENWQVYKYQPFLAADKTFKIDSIFIKEVAVKEGKSFKASFRPTGIKKFMYFETLPTHYDIQPIQYNYSAFAYTDYDLKQEYPVENLYQLSNNEIIQLF